MELQRLKEIIGILMESKLYFELDIRERQRLVKYVLNTYSCV